MTDNLSLNTNTKSLTLMYTLHQSLYWIVVCCIVSFAATYLTDKGLAVSTIGIVLFLANMVSFLLQLFLANIADKAGNSRAIKMLMIILSAVPLLMLIILSLTELPLWLVAVLYIPLVAGFDMELPLMSSVVLFYSKRGYDISFGIGRAVGAAAFGAASLGMGYAMKGLGSDVMLVFAIVFTVAYIAMIFLYPKELALPARSVAEAAGAVGAEGAAGAEVAAGAAGAATGVAEATGNAGAGAEATANAGAGVEGTGNAGAGAEATGNAGAGEPVTDSLPLGKFLVKYKWYAISLLGVMCFGAVHLASENYMIEVVRPLGGDSSTVGIALMIGTFLEMPVTLFADRAYKKLHAHKMWMIIGISYTLRMVIYAFARNIAMIYMGQILQISSYSPMPPSQLLYANDCVDDRDMVKGQSTSTALYSLGNALGNLFGGLAVSAFGVATMLKGCSAGAFIGFLIVTIFVPFALKAGQKITADKADE